MAGYSIVGNVALRNYATPYVYKKLVQSILHVNGKGVDESFVQGQLGNASISIPRVALGEGSFRMLGASVNGGGYNAKEVISPQSDYINVPLMYVYDRVEDIPLIYNDKAGYDLLNNVLDNIAKKITRGINALTFATQLSTVLNEAGKSGEAGLITEYDGTEVTPLDAYIAANTNLDNGDEALGVDFFPTENRQAFVRPEFFGSLLKKNGGVVLNSNLGQEMLATGYLNPFKNSDATKVEMRDGYAGEIAGVGVYKVSGILWKLAAAFCTIGATESAATPAANTVFNGIDAIVCSSWGTIRGFSAAENIVVVPSQRGQGSVAQPLVHGGCICISPKSVQLVVNSTFELPTSSSTHLYILPPESRA